MPLKGSRCIVQRGDALYPQSLETVRYPPEKLYIIGNVKALVPGLAVIGARKATPYGRTCARRFARIAAEKGLCSDDRAAETPDDGRNRERKQVYRVAFLGVGSKTGQRSGCFCSCGRSVPGCI